jgi:hypothetical protein
MVDNTVDESTFYTQQDISYDLQSLYSAFVSQIDAVRSCFATPDQINLKQLSATVLQNVINGSRASLQNVPQESRCNAFYRLLGLPVVGADGRFYNPGYRPDGKTTTVLNNQFSIANTITSNTALVNILNLRESFPNRELKILANQDDNASALAFSLKYLRPVTGIITTSGPLDPDPQTFTVTERTEVLNYYSADEDGNTATVPTTLNHLLKPFMPDPRIDFTVFPVRNRIAVPFLLDSQRKLTDQLLYTRPSLENVARVRCNTSNNEADFPDLAQLATDIQKNGQITDSQLINFSGGVTQYYRSSSYVFDTFLNVFDILTDILYQSIQTIDETSLQIHWQPVPNALGVEEGVTSADFIFNDPLGRSLDDELNRLYSLKQINDSEIDIIKNDLGALTNGTVGGYAMSSLDSIAFGATLSNIPKLYDKRILGINSKRAGLGNRASTALQNIAIIMGDTSGFGLIDMYAIYAALWAVDLTTFVNMFDNDAIQRISTYSSLQCPAVQARIGSTTLPNGTTTLTTFETKVKEVYNIIDALLKSKINNG